MAFPSTLENLPNNIQPTDKVSVRDHAKLHNDVARVVNALQTKMGVDFSSDHNTLDWMIRNMGPGGGSNVIRVSPPQNHVIGSVATFVHDLGFTQADIESGRYQIKFAYKVTTTPANGVDSAGVGALSGAPMAQQYIWDATDPIAPFNIHMQADSLKVLSSSRADDLESVRCIIIDNNIVGGGILPPWTTTYQTSFLVVDSLGNAITDAVITFNGVTNNAGDYTFDTLLGNFSYSCDRPGYITASGDVLIDGVSTHTIVLTATGAGMYNLTFDISSDVLGPLTDAIVTLNGVTHPVGQMVFNMPDDTYNYTVNRLGHDPVIGSVVVAGADVTEVVAMTALPPLYTATFYIEDNVGTPILDARIEFEGNTYPASYYDFITNAGTYNYTVHRLGYTSVSGTLVLSGNTTITITMDPNAALHAVDFTVEDNVGMPVAGASINLNGIQFSAGQYSFNLPTGTYTYIVSKSGYYSAGSFVVVSGPTIENVVLTPITAPTTYQCTFNLSTTSGASISNFCMKVGGTLYPLDQTVITGLAPGTHSYRVKNAADNQTYGAGTITIVAGNIVENVTLTVDLDITPSSPNPVTSGASLVLTAATVGTVMQYTWTYGATVITGIDFIERFPTTNEDRTLVTDMLGGLILETSYNIVVAGVVPQGYYYVGYLSSVKKYDANTGVLVDTEAILGYAVDTYIDAQYIYVTTQANTNCQTINLLTFNKDPLLSFGRNGYMGDVTSDSTWVYAVTNSATGGGGAVSRLNKINGTKEYLDFPNYGFTGICVTGGYAYVFNAVDLNLYKINTTTFTVSTTLPLGPLVIGMHGITTDGTNIFIDDKIISIASFSVISSLPYVINDIVITGGYGYVIQQGSNDVLKINLTTGAVINTITAGIGPIRISTDGISLFVLNSGSETVSKINIASFTVTNTFAATGGPQGISVY